jgi:hypothetical protein
MMLDPLLHFAPRVLSIQSTQSSPVILALSQLRRCLQPPFVWSWWQTQRGHVAALIFVVSFAFSKCWFRPTDDLNHSGLDIYIFIIHVSYIYIIFIYTVYMSYFYVSLMAFDALWFVALTFSSDSNNGCFPTQWQPCCQAGEAYLSACEGWRRWAMVLMGTDGGDWINSMVETKKLIPPPHIVDIPCTSKLIQIVILIGNMIRSWNWVGYPILDKLRSSKVWMCALRNVMSSALGVSSHVATEWFRNDPRSLQHRYEWIPWPFALIN